MKHRILQGIIILALSLTACSKTTDAEVVPTETEEIVLPDVYEETTQGLSSGKILDSGLEYSISMDSTDKYVKVYTDRYNDTYYTLNVLPKGTNDLLMPYEKDYQIERIEDEGWQVVCGISDTIAYKTIDDYSYIITTQLSWEELKVQLPTIE